MKDDHPTRDRPPRPQDTEIFSQCEISKIKEASTEVHWFCQLLSQLHPAIVRKTARILRTIESRQANQRHRRTTRSQQSDQRSIGASLWIGSQTTNHRTTIHPNDGRQFPSLGLCVDDRRRQRQKTQFKKEDNCASRIRIESILPSTAKNVNLLQGIFSNIPRLPRIQPYPVGNNSTDLSDDRQQISNAVFPNKSHTAYLVERVRLCTTIQFPHNARGWYTEYSS